MLPVIATMMMGALSKNASAQGLIGGSNSGSTLTGLLGMLDMDKDGSPIDDIMKMVGGLKG